MSFVAPFLLLGWLIHRQPSGDVGRIIAQRVRRGLRIELLCIGVVLVLALLSTLVSPEPHRAFRLILPMLFGASAIFVLPLLQAPVARRLAYAAVWTSVVLIGSGLLLFSASGTRALVAPDYRFVGFFDNANQLSLALITILPLALALALVTTHRSLKLSCAAATLILIGALLLTAGKTAMVLGFVTCSATAAYYACRDQRSSRALLKLLFVIVMAAVAIPVSWWLINLASPVTAEKISTILTGGVSDYATIQSRNELWAESLRLGLENPWTGVGAGSHVFGYTHSHNVILDYFRGIGILGALSATILLCVVTYRTVAFYLGTIRNGRSQSWRDTTTVALYLGAFGYFSGNQLSDSFSPSTSFLFWLVYVTAFTSELSGRLRVRRIPRPRASETPTLMNRRVSGVPASWSGAAPGGA